MGGLPSDTLRLENRTDLVCLMDVLASVNIAEGGD